MNIVHYSKPSPQKKEGEDAIVLNPAARVYGVMDGVTPIVDYRDEDGHNGAYLASNTIRVYLERLQGSINLKESMVAANGAIRQAMLDSGIDLNVKHGLWASCFAAAYVDETGGISYAQIGDCMAIARYADGRVQVLTENRVSGVAARAKVKRAKEREMGKTVEDESYFENVHARIVYHRTFMANTAEGYGVANGTPEMESYIQAGVVPAEGLTHLLLISDGMFHPGLPLETTMERIVQEGFEPYVEQVEAAEKEKGMNPDDRSAVLFTF
ncbi:protein phosphatase 2C domain-containing protein [Paenibacillus ginsengarvi]|uniref:Serine/threonine protein phosphatase n=1 Tax=Paenibacillus ginsengarvi TaxID=400777 RepID=A0A3B0CRQ5_9BACL|nr:protein phosphatase 2C domain-containing protein [Paenibacillus ginsengarvi]RKN86424.1 serine/threonine protein phosphatase [Paenibacillus ginsengarvi]